MSHAGGRGWRRELPEKESERVGWKKVGRRDGYYFFTPQELEWIYSNVRPETLEGLVDKDPCQLAA